MDSVITYQDLRRMIAATGAGLQPRPPLPFTLCLPPPPPASNHYHQPLSAVNMAWARSEWSGDTITKLISFLFYKNNYFQSYQHYYIYSPIHPLIFVGKGRSVYYRLQWPGPAPGGPCLGTENTKLYHRWRIPLLSDMREYT